MGLPMKNFIKYNLPIIILLIVIGSIFLINDLNNIVTNQQKDTHEKFGGNVPMRIYQIYDRDTGVYYAITETGSITPLYNIDGSLKLVDNGDPGQSVIYKEAS